MKLLGLLRSIGTPDVGGSNTPDEILDEIYRLRRELNSLGFEGYSEEYNKKARLFYDRVREARESGVDERKLKFNLVKAASDMAPVFSYILDEERREGDSGLSDLGILVQALKLREYYEDDTLCRRKIDRIRVIRAVIKIVEFIEDSPITAVKSLYDSEELEWLWELDKNKEIGAFPDIEFEMIYPVMDILEDESISREVKEQVSSMVVDSRMWSQLGDCLGTHEYMLIISKLGLYLKEDKLSEIFKEIDSEGPNFIDYISSRSKNFRYKCDMVAESGNHRQMIDLLDEFEATDALDKMRVFRGYSTIERLKRLWPERYTEVEQAYELYVFKRALFPISGFGFLSNIRSHFSESFSEVDVLDHRVIRDDQVGDFVDLVVKYKVPVAVLFDRYRAALRLHSDYDYNDQEMANKDGEGIEMVWRKIFKQLKERQDDCWKYDDDWDIPTLLRILNI